MSFRNNQSSRGMAGAMSPDRDQRASPDVFDVEGMLARYGGDASLLIEMIGFFLEDEPQLRSELSAAVAENDAARVRKAAHALKGLARACGGNRVADAAQRLEAAGESGKLTNLPSLMESLEGELEVLRRALATDQP